VTVTPDAVGLAHHARTCPDKPALIVGDARVSYARLNARVNQLARALRRVGVGPGSGVAAVLHNSVEWFELLNAVGKIGAQLVPVGYRLKAPEIAYMITDSGARVIIGAADLRTEIDRAVDDLGGPDRALWTVGADTPWRGRAYEDVLADESEDEPAEAHVGGGFNVLMYTSGTTGRPKGIDRAVDPSAAHLTLLGIANLWGLDATDVHLVAGPLYHTASRMPRWANRCWRWSSCAPGHRRRRQT